MARNSGSDKSYQDPWGFGLENLSRKDMVPCLECGTYTKGRHHVIPKVRSGKRQVPLCAICHSKAHDMSQRVLIREGLDKRRGIPRPKKTSAKQDQKIIDLRAAGMPYKKIAKKMRLAVGTIHARLNPRPTASEVP